MQHTVTHPNRGSLAQCKTVSTPVSDFVYYTSLSHELYFFCGNGLA